MPVNTPLPRIMVAPNGARRTRADHPALPMTIQQTVETAAACFDQGAGAIHGHVRDADGSHVLDAGLYRELIAELKTTVPEMMVQITTEAVGRYNADQQRKVIREVMPEYVSVAVREMLPDAKTAAAKEFYHWAREADIQIQHLLYAPDEIDFFRSAIDAGVIPENDLKVLFVLGRYATQQDGEPNQLKPYLDRMTATGLVLDWAICAFGTGETACLREAFKQGGKARVGFENSLWNLDGSLAKDNAERVREVAAI